VDLDDDQVKGVVVIDNPYYRQHSPGVVPEFTHNQKANVMISGGVGSQAVA